MTLRLRQVTAGYGGGTVLEEVHLDVEPGTVQAIVGRNGAGKTTLTHVIAGLRQPYAGSITMDDVDLTLAPAHRVARAGVSLVPQGRRVFASLTVAEHLDLAASRRRDGAASPRGWSVPELVALLPNLGERLRHRGDQLSGGEQQMLAIARALLTRPRLVLMDEPTEGLAPAMTERVHSLVRSAAERGTAVLLMERSAACASAVTDRVASLRSGRLLKISPED